MDPTTIIIIFVVALVAVSWIGPIKRRGESDASYAMRRAMWVPGSEIGSHWESALGSPPPSRMRVQYIKLMTARYEAFVAEGNSPNPHGFLRENTVDIWHEVFEIRRANRKQPRPD